MAEKLSERLGADAELIHNNGITRKLRRHRVAALLREAAELARRVEDAPVADIWEDAYAAMLAAAPQPPSAPVGVEEMQRRLDREESDHGRTIDQRDAAEDALGRMFQAVTGRVAEWSSAWGYTDAIEEVEEHVAALAQQPASVGEEIMVNAGHDVFILPLQPSGLSSGPRFVVHVPAHAQKFKVGDRVVACETFYHDEVQGIRVGACGTVRESRYNGEIFLVDFDGITPSKGVNEHDGAWEMFAHQLELAPDTRPAALAAQHQEPKS